MPIYVHIVRHGETTENRTGVIQGQLDTSLNEEGINQARKAGERFTREGIWFEKIWTSDLKRTRDVRRSPIQNNVKLRNNQTTDIILSKTNTKGDIEVLETEKMRERVS